MQADREAQVSINANCLYNVNGMIHVQVQAIRKNAAQVATKYYDFNPFLPRVSKWGQWLRDCNDDAVAT